MKFEELKKKHPNVDFNHEPNPECKFCKGEGEYLNKQDKLIICICTFVDHRNSNFAGDMFQEFVKNLFPEKENKQEMPF